MLAIPTPLPDELYRSHVGRTIRANGLGTERDLVYQLSRAADTVGFKRRRAELIELQSSAVRMDLASFICQHTMVPLWRSIAWDSTLRLHGLSSCGSGIDYGLRVLRSNLQFCPDCIRSDTDKFGVSYWHRQHQHLGTFWCPTHRISLNSIGEWRGQLDPPSRFLDASWKMEDGWCDLVFGYRKVRQFLRIVDGLMDSHQPYRATDVIAVLRHQAVAGGLPVSRTAMMRGADRLLSDKICSSFPMPWLIQVMPEFGQKKPGRYLSVVDGVLDSRENVTMIAPYALALCELFESADDALGQLESISAHRLALRPRIDEGIVRCGILSFPKWS